MLQSGMTAVIDRQELAIRPVKASLAKRRQLLWCAIGYISVTLASLAVVGVLALAGLSVYDGTMPVTPGTVPAWNAAITVGILISGSLFWRLCLCSIDSWLDWIESPRADA